MKKGILYILCVFVMIGAVSAATECWQESATQATTCGGLASGSYNWTGTTWTNIANINDGNWTSAAKYNVFKSGEYFVTYAKPSGALSDSKWRISAASYNSEVALPSSCFAQPQLKLRLSINKDGCATCTNLNLKSYCWNGTAWQKLSYGNSAATYIYEEGMKWKMNDIGVANPVNVTCPDCTPIIPSSMTLAYGYVKIGNQSVANTNVTLKCNSAQKIVKTGSDGSYLTSFSNTVCTVGNTVYATANDTNVSAIVIKTAGMQTNMASLPLILIQEKPKPYNRCNPGYDDVLLITNENSNIGIQVSNYYKEKRGITHQLFINVTDSETISYANYNKSIKAVVAKYLVDNNLENKINYIVVTKGVPIKTTWTAGMQNGVKSVDSMLVSVLSNSTDTGWYKVNPVFRETINATSVKETYNMYFVTRLDGRNYEDIIKLIPNDICNNFKGKVLLDRNPSKSGGYTTWNNKIETANNILVSKGYATKFENTTAFVTSNIGEVNLDGYYSWGSNDKGSCDITANSSAWTFTFNPGSIGDTGVSTSARTFNGYWSRDLNGTVWVNCTQSLITDLIHMGISGVKGYVAEPYVSAISEPDIAFDRYTNGYNLAQSLYMSSRYINWMDIYIGDPKITVADKVQ